MTRTNIYVLMMPTGKQWRMRWRHSPDGLKFDIYPTGNRSRKTCRGDYFDQRSQSALRNLWYAGTVQAGVLACRAMAAIKIYQLMLNSDTKTGECGSCSCTISQPVRGEQSPNVEQGPNRYLLLKLYLLLPMWTTGL